MSVLSPVRRFRRSTAGTTVVEFAFVAPLMLAIFFGGYAVAQSVSASRKVTITARTLADLATQFTTLSSTDMSTILNASAQIMAPFSTAPLGLRLTEITTNASGTAATVTWSVGSQLTAYTKGVPFTLPASMLKANTSYVYSEVHYVFTPIANFSVSSMNVNDQFYMLPRLSSSITYSG